MSHSSLFWSQDIYACLKDKDVRQVAYVPDSGHAHLIERLHADDKIIATPLTSEEEGVALLGGAWLGGQRGALLMQSSGVGNCVNMLSLVPLCGFPLLTLVTMRGEWGEFNPWQVPMSQSVQQCFEMMDIRVMRAEVPQEVKPIVEAAARMTYEGHHSVAVLIGQRVVGAKDFSK